MKTYRIIVVALIMLGIPTLVSALAFKATIVATANFTDQTSSIIVAGITWVIVFFATSVMGDEFQLYLREY